MESSRASGTLGVVFVDTPGRPVAHLPAVRELVVQVDELLVLGEGVDTRSEAGVAIATAPTTGSLRLDWRSGRAVAWNIALSSARERNSRYLYVLDQADVPSPDAVATAVRSIDMENVAAVVQPTGKRKSHLRPFPWDTVASGALFDVAALQRVGGFDERLFLDEVDHEVLARLMGARYLVRELPTSTVDRPNSSQQSRGGRAGGGDEPRRLRGFSVGLLIRRYMGSAPATSARLLLGQTLASAQDLCRGDRSSASSRVSGLVGGLATRRPPPRAPARACPYCEGPLVGRFAAVPDWRFGAGAPADVYWCPDCGALAAGRVPEQAEMESWYADYYTHAVEPSTARQWSRMWPTPRRRRELGMLRSYLTPPQPGGRFLEVGTGSGERLVQFADAGWSVVGQDLDPNAGGVARNCGLDVHHCPVGELVAREEPFDLIGLNHVLEHATEPAELLSACASLLAPMGRLCVISPNAQALGRLMFGQWWFGLEQPRHVAIPTLASLERLTTRVGLEAVYATSVATHGTVILGGSLARRIDRCLPPGSVHRAARFSVALLGQAMARAAVVISPRLGEEVVWLGHRRGE